MKKHTVLLVLLAPILLAGCESMSVSECKVADWARMGMADGARGGDERRIAAYAEDCGKVGIVPNAAAYRRGWDAGIVQFCTPANGWREGLQGHAGKASVCQGQAGFAGFARYLESGLQVHRTQERMQRNASESERLQKKLEESKSDDEKKDVRSDLRQLDHDQVRLRKLLTEQQLLGP